MALDHKMAAQIPAPAPMDIKGDVASNWKFFRSSFEDYLVATKLDAEDENTRVATLRSVLGKEAKMILQHLDMTDENRRRVTPTLESLEAYFLPQTNVVYERYVFRSALQQTGETFDEYLARLRRLASTCSYHQLEDEMIRDNIVYGIQDDSVRARLLREKDLKLPSAIDSCRASERARAQAKSMQAKDEQVNFTRKVHGSKFRSRPTSDFIKSCKYCGGSHECNRDKCPAYGKTCLKCSRDNHFASCCTTRDGKQWSKKSGRKFQKSKGRVSSKSVHVVASDNDNTEDSDEYCYTVSDKPVKRYMTTVKFRSQGKITPVQCQLDTGASRNTMPLEVYRQITGSNSNLRPSTTQLRTYDGGILKPLGFDRIQIETDDGPIRVHVEVVEKAPVTLLSGNTGEKLNLLTVNDQLVMHCGLAHDKMTRGLVLRDYKDVFTGLGQIGTLHIETDPNVKPVQNHSRRVPVPLQRELKDKLGEMEQKGIICRVNTPTPWINNMVAVKTPTKLRICLDPQELNKAVYRNHFPTQTLEELAPKLNSARIFTVVDAKDGFNQIVLDDDSSFLTTFWTPFGRFRWLRLPFGINSAPEEFSRILQDCLEGLPNVEVIADDILVYGSGSTDEEAEVAHDKAFKALMERARQRCLKLNPTKVKFKMPSVAYMGHIISAKGLQTDPEKVKAVVQMPVPTDVAGVQRLLGLVNYLSKFTPHLSSVCEPLRRLVDRDRPFSWLPQHDEAFKEIKALISSAPTLKFFDAAKPVTLECDASSVGLGAVLLQEGQPVAFASRALSATERNYAPIEWEALAVVFACEHFDSYILGKHVTVYSDHKPLETILNKSILKAPKRLQRMRLRLQRYELTVCHKSGKYMYISDALSRASLKSSNSVLDPTKTVIYTLGAAPSIAQEIESINPREGVSICDSRLERIKECCASDIQMQQLGRVIHEGWPDNKQQVPTDIREYWSYRDELNVHDGLLFRGTRVIIPQATRAEMIRKSHEAHQGIEATLQFARDVIYWPQMNKQLEEACRQCATCNQCAVMQREEPMMSYPIPDHPYQIVSSDVMEYEGQHYIVAVDHYSDYIEVQHIKDLTTKTTVKFFQNIFATHGIPLLLITDCGTNYTSREFAEFATEHGMNHVTSSPHHHQSNGRGEAAVKVVRGLLTKADLGKKPLGILLLAQRNTPSKGMNSSPTQRLMSRRTRTLLPAPRKAYFPEVREEVRELLLRRKQQNKRVKDRKARPLPELLIGQPIRAKAHPQNNRDPWVPATVSAKVNHRSWLVNFPGKGNRVRNRIHIKETTETPVTQQPSGIGEMPPQTAQMPHDQHDHQMSPRAESHSSGAPEVPTDTSVKTITEAVKSNDQKTTRSGRVVKTPQKYKQ